MIVVKKLEMRHSNTGTGIYYYGLSLDQIMTDYINHKKLVKEDIILIDIISSTCGFITHLEK